MESISLLKKGRLLAYKITRICLVPLYAILKEFGMESTSRDAATRVIC